jgi:RNA polymerase sigma factor (sigma-70 family)
MATGKSENYLLLRDRYLNGDSKALAILYFEAFDSLYNYGIKFTRNKEIVEDSIQNLFVDLLSNKKKLSNVNNLKTYLFKSLKYIILKELTSNNILDNFDLSEASFLISQPIEKSIINKEEKDLNSKLLLQVYNSLGEREKEAIYLKYNCELSYPEISKILEISIESTRTLIYRGIKKIRKSFDSTL